MDILLANAGVKNRSKHSRLNPPLGLAYIASTLLQHGYSVVAQDFNVATFAPAQTAGLLEHWSPGIVGISVNTETYLNGLRLAETAKQVNPLVTVVMGGPHATPMYREILQEQNVDIVVRGEGEHTMLELADCITRNVGSLPEIKGIAYREGDSLSVTPDRPFVEDPDELPFPARELFPLPFYEQPGQVLMSRGGCPFKCDFCAVNSIWKGARRFRAMENVVREILYVHERFGFDRIGFADDTFTLDREQVLRLCRQSGQIRDVFPWRWGCTTRVDLVDPSLLEKMREAGCDSIAFGIEAGSQRILQSINKKTTLAQVRNAVASAVANDMAVLCSFMFPHPEDTADTIREQKEFMKELTDIGAKVSVAFTTPFPGTRYYEEAEKLGIRTLTDKWDEFDAKHLVITTRHLGREELQALWDEIVRDVGIVDSTQDVTVKQEKTEIEGTSGQRERIGLAR